MIYPDFSDKYVLANFMRHPHGRRMICALMHLTENKAPFFATHYGFWSSPENKRTLMPLMKGAFQPIRQYRETLEVTGECEVTSPEFQSLQKVARANGPLSSATLDVIDMASPILTEGAIMALLQTPNMTLTARSLLHSNENCPPELVVAPPVAISPLLALAAARYGDMSNIKTVRLIESTLFASAHPHRKPAMAALLSRPTLTKLAASIADKYVTDAEHILLSQHEGYLEHTREKYGERGVVPADIVASGGGTKLPPNIAATNLENLYFNLERSDGITDVSHARALIALHPNAGTALVERALGNPAVKNYLLELTEGCESPHAEWVIRLKGERRNLQPMFIATLKSATPESLLWAAKQIASDLEDEDLKPTLTHPNFPWHEADAEKLFFQSNLGHQAGAVAAARWLRGAPGCHNKQMEQYPGSVLFSPNISAVRLEKLVAKHPKQAAWAACHPNGQDIAVKDEHSSAIATMFRAKFQAPSLAGKSASVNLPNETQLIEV